MARRPADSGVLLIWSRKVGAAHDASECHEGRVVRAVLLHQGFERAPPPRVLMWIGRAGRIEAGRPLAPLYLGDLLGLDEQDRRVRVDEADEPCGRGWFTLMLTHVMLASSLS